MTKGVKLDHSKVEVILAMRFGQESGAVPRKVYMSYAAIARITKVNYNTVRRYCVQF